MDWILDKIPILIFALVVGAKVIAALLKSGRARAEHESQRDDSAEQRRAAEVQEEIRRRIAERRGGAMARTPSSPDAPPQPRPLFRRADTTEPPDPIGGALRRVLEHVERNVQPSSSSAEPPVLTSQRRAELERQQRLAEEMKALEDARALAVRRAAHAAAEQKVQNESGDAARAAARGRVFDDLREPDALRRAFVLREVLGTPVGLR